MTIGSRVFLARHGQSQWNASKRIAGQANPGLSAMGKLQAITLAQRLHDEPLAAIYSSPLRRCLETATPVAREHQLAVIEEPALKEIKLGSLEGRYRDERDPEAARLWQRWQGEKSFGRLPWGESYAELEQRILPCLQTILDEAKDNCILIVGHQNTNRIILRALMNWDLKTALTLAIRTRYLYEISLKPVPTIRTLALGPKLRGRSYAGFRS